MQHDYRINWRMPAQPLGPAIRPEAAPAQDHVADFERGDHAAEAAEDMLPEGVIEAGPGEYKAECCCCGQWGPIYCDLSEIPAEGYQHYCGGSPRCCP